MKEHSILVEKRAIIEIPRDRPSLLQRSKVLLKLAECLLAAFRKTDEPPIRFVFLNQFALAALAFANR